MIGRSGGLSGPNETGEVDPWSHFINVLMLDRNGNRIDRRNPQDIFTPLYDKQIPPGAGQVVHFTLDVPKDVTGPVELTVRLRYRKFDYEYMELVHKESGKPVPKLPIVDICEDAVTLPVAGVAETVAGAGIADQARVAALERLRHRLPDSKAARWIRRSGNLRQAEAAFRKLLTLGAKDAVWHGHLNLARVLHRARPARASASARN